MDLVNTVLSIPSVQTLIGALIAFVISWIFYQRAAEDLKRTAQDLGAQNKQLQQQNENLKRMNGVTLRILEISGLLPDNVVVTKDANGEPTGGLTYKKELLAQSRMTATEQHKVIRRGEASPPPEQGFSSPEEAAEKELQEN